MNCFDRIINSLKLFMIYLFCIIPFIKFELNEMEFLDSDIDNNKLLLVRFQFNIKFRNKCFKFLD